METEPAFTITYWGITGSMSAPLRPPQVSAKIVRTLEHLINEGRLAGVQPGPNLREALEREVAALPRHLGSTYGGNTTCLEVRTADNLFILDCGSGFRELGVDLQRRWNSPDFQGERAAQVLVTHPHMDHTFAKPFFSPYYDPRNNFTIWGTQSVLKSLSAVLSSTSSLSQTYFPPTFDLMKAIRQLRELAPGQDIQIGSTRIKTYALNHPGGCLAFRLENAGRVFVYATDHEQQAVPDTGLAEFAQGADLLYTEGQYTQAEYEGREALPGEVPLPRLGWGHSPMEACVTTALAARVRHLHVGHRDPSRTDPDLARLEHYCRQLAREQLAKVGQDPESLQVAIPYEGMTIAL